MKNIDYANTPLVKKFIELNSGESNPKNHIFLYAGGGYGKTTAMKCLYLYLVSQAKTRNDIVPIYIDVKELNFRKSNPIISYIHSEYSGVNTTESDVENLFKKQAPSFSKKYTYYILIDGLNETNDSNKKSLMDDISDMNSNSSNIRFVVSSRVKENFNRVSFNTFQLKGLDEDKIKNYLDKEFGKKYNENTDVNKINKSLIEILKIPMFMNVFSKTYNKKSPYPDIYTDRAVRRADILDSYIQKILNDLKERTDSSDNDILEFVINFYLPALAFQMVENNTFIIEDEDVDKKLNLKYFLTFFRGTKKEKLNSIINSYKFTPISICNINFALINDNEGNYSFVHQIWRDFFAAKHIINCMNAEKLDALEVFVDENVRQFVGELVREYNDEYKYNKKPDYDSKHTNGRIEYVYSPDTRKCECDFESKNSIDTPMSPIEEFMQRNHTVLNDKPEAIRNLIEIMKASRNDCITGNYKNLNLSLSNFNNCYFRNSSFENSIIVDSTFFNNGHNDEITRMLMLNDNKTLVSGDSHGIIKLWNVETSEIIDEIDTDSDIIFLGHWNNETIIAVCRTGKFVHYNINTRELTEYYLEYTLIHKVEMSSDCKYAVLNMLDNIKVLTKKDDRFVCIKKINMGNSRVKSISISPDNNVFIYTSENNNMYLCSLDESENGIYVTNGFHIDRNVNGIFFKDEKTLIFNLEDIGFVECSFGESQPCKELNITAPHCKISYNSNTDSLALYDHNTRKLTLKTTSKRITVNNCIDKNDYLSTLKISDDGKFILIGTGQKRMIYLYDSQNLSLPYKTFLGQSLHITCLCESNNFFYFGTLNDLIYKADKTNGRIIDFYKYKFISLLHSIAISSNEKYLAFSTIDSHGYYLLVIDVESREVINKYKLDADIIEIAFSDDCNSLAVKYSNNKSQVFNISSTIDINDKNTLSIDSALDNLYEMKNFRYYRRQIYKNGNEGFCKKINGQIIWENNDLVNGCLIDCNFQNAKYIGKNNSAFYKKLYLNGAIVPLELKL